MLRDQTEQHQIKTQEKVRHKLAGNSSRSRRHRRGTQACNVWNTYTKRSA